LLDVTDILAYAAAMLPMVIATFRHRYTGLESAGGCIRVPAPPLVLHHRAARKLKARYFEMNAG
jgi:hypothetical protein